MPLKSSIFVEHTKLKISCWSGEHAASCELAKTTGWYYLLKEHSMRKIKSYLKSNLCLPLPRVVRSHDYHFLKILVGASAWLYRYIQGMGACIKILMLAISCLCFSEDVSCSFSCGVEQLGDLRVRGQQRDTWWALIRDGEHLEWWAIFRSGLLLYI